MLKIYKGFVFLKYFNETNFIIKNSELLLLNFTNSLNLRLIFNEKTNKTAEMRYISAVFVESFLHHNSPIFIA